MKSAADLLDAGYLAGATLNALDNLVRQDFSWAGVRRQRLALQSALAAVILSGRREDETTLRDTHYLRDAGDDPGPAGHVLMAWRRMASLSTSCDEEIRFDHQLRMIYFRRDHPLRWLV